MSTKYGMMHLLQDLACIALGMTNCEWPPVTWCLMMCLIRPPFMTHSRSQVFPIMPSDHTGSADLWAKRPSARLYPFKYQTNVYPIYYSLSYLLHNSAGAKERPPTFLSICFDAPPLSFLFGVPPHLSFPILLYAWVLYPHGEEHILTALQL